MKPVIKSSTVLTTIILGGLEWKVYEGGIAVCNSTVGYMPMDKDEKVESTTDVLKWLNSKFINTFSEEERKNIIKIDMLNENDWNIIEGNKFLQDSYWLKDYKVRVRDIMGSVVDRKGFIRQMKVSRSCGVRPILHLKEKE